jgi:hypothetical protein
MIKSTRKSAFVGPALLGLLFAGCASTRPAAKHPGPAITRAIARSVVLCKTTEAELRQKLGEPSRDGVLHEARVMSWIASTEPLTRYLAALLDAHGVVVDLYWDIPTEVPWVPTDQCHGR